MLTVAKSQSSANIHIVEDDEEEEQRGFNDTITKVRGGRGSVGATGRQSKN